MQDAVIRSIGQADMRSGVEPGPIARNDPDDVAAFQFRFDLGDAVFWDLVKWPRRPGRAGQRAAGIWRAAARIPASVQSDSRSAGMPSFNFAAAENVGLRVLCGHRFARFALQIRASSVAFDARYFGHGKAQTWEE